MEKKINYPILVADLVQELVDFGYNINDIIFILTRNGMTEKQILEWYGLTHKSND